MARAEFGVRVIANPVNRGFCAANNQAFAAARGEFVALLNNDAEAEPDFLAHLRRAFDVAPDIGMAAAKVLVWEDPRRIDKVGHLIYPDGQNRGRGTGEIDAGPVRPHARNACGRMAAPPCTARPCWTQIGGFDEDFFMFADDAELGLRARIAGWRCLYMPGAVVRHHRGGSLDAGSTGRIFLIERNRVLLAAKLFPWSLLLLNPYYFALAWPAGCWRRRAKKARWRVSRVSPTSCGWRGPSCARIWPLRMLPRTLRKRRTVRRLAKLTPREIRRLILDNRIAVRALVEKAN